MISFKLNTNENENDFKNENITGLGHHLHTNDMIR